MRVLFAGPSISGIDPAALGPGVVLRPPAVRGDVARAVRDGARAIGIVDGCFSEVPSVWHKEILEALERGVPVGGGASMGALRAVECEAFGMVGIGAVFEDYRDGRLLDDEAVALVHGPAETGFVPLSVPWVDFEATVAAALAAEAVTPAERDRLVLAGRQLHFSGRTFAAAVDLVPVSADRRLALRAALKTHHVARKREDALAVARWLATVAERPRPRWTLSVTSHWQRLVDQDAATARPARVAP